MSERGLVFLGLPKPRKLTVFSNALAGWVSGDLWLLIFLLAALVGEFSAESWLEWRSLFLLLSTVCVWIISVVLVLGSVLITCVNYFKSR